MRICSLPILLIFVGGPTLGFSQKVAEGEYEMRGVSLSEPTAERVATRWVLYRKGPSGYRLESEMENLPDSIRVVQKEELDRQLVPIAIGYEGYLKGQQKPGAALTCKFIHDSIRCFGLADCRFVPQSDACDQFPSAEKVSSKPYQYKGPFLMWAYNLNAWDVPWLCGGGVNMAHLKAGKSTLAALVVSGGPGLILGDAVASARMKQAKTRNFTFYGADPNEEWDFNSEEVGALEFINREDVEISGTKVSTRHYVYELDDQPVNLWTTDSGLLLKMVDDGREFFLSHYKQYKKLVPELKVDEQ